MLTGQMSLSRGQDLEAQDIGQVSFNSGWQERPGLDMLPVNEGKLGRGQKRLGLRLDPTWTEGELGTAGKSSQRRLMGLPRPPRELAEPGSLLSRPVSSSQSLRGRLQQTFLYMDSSVESSVQGDHMPHCSFESESKNLNSQKLKISSSQPVWTSSHSTELIPFCFFCTSHHFHCSSAPPVSIGFPHIHSTRIR